MSKSRRAGARTATPARLVYRNDLRIHDVSRIADVVRALKESELCNTDGKPGCRNLVVVPVKVLFKAMGASEQHYSIELAEVVVNEFKLELVCEDQQVDELVDIIGRGSRISQVEAGWIYVSDIISATPIRWS